MNKFSMLEEEIIEQVSEGDSFVFIHSEADQDETLYRIYIEDEGLSADEVHVILHNLRNAMVYTLDDINREILRFEKIIQENQVQLAN